jgi:hypothetical protein
MAFFFWPKALSSFSIKSHSINVSAPIPLMADSRFGVFPLLALPPLFELLTGGQDVVFVAASARQNLLQAIGQHLAARGGPAERSISDAEIFLGDFPAPE